MNDIERPIVVYHVAAMGNWQDVVKEQLLLLHECGLDEVRLTHVGCGLEWVLAEAAKAGVFVTLVRSDPNTDHYETFAMLEVERLAKVERTMCPILYMHTKGVSDPSNAGKDCWRRVMEEHLVRRWRDHVPHLANGFDAVGVNWIRHGEQHFSGNFWLASPEWIRRLPDYVGYHHAKNRVRYSCEMWIGAAQWCRAYSLACSDQPFWQPGYNFAQLLPPTSPPHALYDRYVTTVSPPNMAASWETLEWLWQTAMAIRPRSILDLGSGVSSAVLRSLPRGPAVWTVDDDPNWLDRTFHFLSANRLNTSRMYPLQAFESHWPRGEFDLVFYDLGSIRTRVERLAWAAARVAPSGAIILDDMHFPEVATAVAQCLSEYRWQVVPIFETIDSYGRFAALATRRAVAIVDVAPVSVCLPTIPPRRQLLHRALDSIASQTTAPANIIVECDRTREGAVATRNRALARVTTPWVTFLDDDDEMHPDHIQSLTALAENTGADFVFSYFDLKIDGVVRNDLDPLGTFGREIDPANPHQATVTVMVRTNLAQRIRFREPLPGATSHGQRHGEDYQFLLDCLTAGAKVRHLARRTWTWHHWSGNTSGRGDRW